MRILHFLGGTSIEVTGTARDRADEDDDHAARARSHGVVCDVVCTGRFYDFLERRDGRWGIVLRQPIYEKDRLNPVDPAASLHARRRAARALSRRLPPSRLSPDARSGLRVKPDMPGLTGPEVEELYARGEAWLEGGL